MSIALKRFKSWLFESRSFIFSWYKKNSDRMQEPAKSLAELPSSVREKIVEATRELGDNPSDTDAIRNSIDEAFESWRDRPENAENSIVILISPVMVVSRIVISILQEWSTPKQVSVKVLPWNERPVVDSIRFNLQQYFEEANATQTECPQVMVIPNLSWCFLRSMDGLDGIDYLQQMLLGDSSRFWIIAADRFSWNYLNLISDIEADCGKVFSLLKLTGDSLRDWLKPILAQFNVSYAKPRLESRILEQGKDVETIYFEDLALISQGVSVVALYAFLASIQIEQFNDANVRQSILEAQNPELPSLPDLTTAHHYILYFILLHGDITLSSLAHSLGDKPSKVLGQVKFLRREGLVKAEGETLTINPIHYPKLKQELIGNNFIIID